MSDDWGLPDPLIFAVGAVAWGAINIESHGVSLCELVLSASQGRAPYSALVQRAIEVLAKSGVSPAKQAASAWLSESVVATNTRNAILHAQHVVQYPGGKNDPAWLNHWPNRGGDPIDTPLDEEHLLGVARSFTGLWDRWVGVYTTLAEEIDPPQTF